ncbi:ATP synthase mitochondrial F1 complex assembly factor 1-like [Glandiceps talaboti]
MAAPMRPYFLLPARCRNYFRFIRDLQTATSVYQKADGDGLEGNPYYSKYSAKIEEMRRTNPEEFKTRFEQKENRKKASAKVNDAAADRLRAAREGKPSMSSSSSRSTQKTLDSVMKLELIQDKTTEEITQIWKDYHSQKDCIAAAIPSRNYEKIHERSQKYPMFLYLLPRKQGYEFILGQFDNHNCHFTSLINYQAYGENSPVLLTMIHYTELQKNKGIVLMQGELDTNTLQVHEAQFLGNQIQMYYGSDDQSKLNLLDNFNNHPENFKHTDLIQELESTKVTLPTEQ